MLPMKHGSIFGYGPCAHRVAAGDTERGLFGRCLAVLAWLCVSTTALAAPAPAPASGSIDSALMEIRSAALAGQADKAASLFADDLALVSQSGKLYGKDGALADLGNGFTEWNNSEIVVRQHKDTAVVTLINQRTRTSSPTARFRILQMWRKATGGWQLSAQSSVRLPD